MKKLTLSLTLMAFILTINASASTLGYWRFEEGTNDTIAPLYWNGNNVKWFQDSSGNGNDMPTWDWWTSPRYTNALPFSTVPQTGTANTLACWFGGGNPPNIDDDIWSEGAAILNEGSNFSNGWTVEVSVNFLQDDIWQVVVGKDGDPNSAGPPLFGMKFNASNQMLEMNVYDGGTNVHWLSTGANSILAGNWYSVAGICDGSTVKLYLKGPTDFQYVELDSVAVSGGPMAAYYGNWSIGRGQWGGGNADWCNALIDEVRISDEALQPSQLLGVAPEPGMIISGIILALLVFRRK